MKFRTQLKMGGVVQVNGIPMYKVEWRETLSKIAPKVGMSTTLLYAKNAQIPGISNDPNRELKEGLLLKL